MKQGITMAQEAFKWVNTPEIKALINGGIYLFHRPVNSGLVDLVINALALTNTQVQAGVFVINVHAQNADGIAYNNKNDDQTPDVYTLQNVSQAVAEHFENKHIDSYWMWIETPGLPFQDADGSWYVSIRVNYRNFQNNFKN